MKNYRITLQYDGTRYSGWQKQGNTENTIQGKLEAILSKMTGSETDVHGSGRTDAGVHALAQVASFKCRTTLSETQMQDYFNEYLPLDIRILSLSEAAPRFHARLNASKKHYRYLIDTNKIQNVFSRKYITHIPVSLDIKEMSAASSFLLGEHDFKSFCDNKHMKKSTVRRIDSIDLTIKDGILTIDFFGNGFLYHMARILVGTLLEIGQKKRKPEDINSILQAKDRSAAGFTAPPQGLYLVEVFY
ncbi:MAG: tRNA pseudouridine(38-40) synthase TruA [Lachnospiraceae bacterium]|jgi:tRNA pseudouridine38-40 synthase|nr:tRNA pseudouridine(38-40) synthase TruA [Lachnospiraceae bacterium]